MSDANLDDFFAKKDKSKKKGKTAKFTAGEILSEKTEKEKKRKKKDTTGSSKEKSSNASSTKNLKEDDEWHDYEEETKKDFSDLKIQKLQMTNKDDFDDNERVQDGSGSDDEDGKGSEKKDANTGPWNKATVVPPVLEPVRQEVKPEPPKEEPKPTGKYVPPGARRAKEAADSSGGLQPVSLARTRGKKKATLDVMSEEDFPTLGAVDTNDPAPPPAKFEPVRGGLRPIEDPRNTSQRVELGNKFSALSQGES